VGGGTILTLSGVLAWPWPRLQVPGPVRSVPHRIDTAGLGYDVLPLAARTTTCYKAASLSISELLDSSHVRGVANGNKQSHGLTVGIHASFSKGSRFES
jgi:hypothetical protein